MKFQTTVSVPQLAWTELKHVCPSCGHEETLKADTPGMSEEVEVPVEFVLPDRILTRGEDGRVSGSSDTANVLRETYG